MRPTGIITDTEQRVLLKPAATIVEMIAGPSKDFGSLVLIAMLFVEHEREIMPEKPPRAVIREADLFAKRGSNRER